MADFLSAVPTWLIGLLIVGVSVGGSLVALALLRRVIPRERLKPHHDVAGALINVQGVAYAVLLAFIAIAVWERFDAAGDAAQQEASELVALYRDVGVFPEPLRDNVRTGIESYAQTVRNQEWPAMAHGEGSAAAEEEFQAIWVAIRAFKPTTAHEEVWYGKVIDRLNEVSVARFQRIDQAGSGLPSVLWVMIVAGGLLLIVGVFLFGVESALVHSTLVVTVCGTIAFIVFLVLVLDYPFTGDVSVSPEAFDLLLKEIQQFRG